jgi:kumamolisin
LIAKLDRVVAAPLSSPGPGRLLTREAARVDWHGPILLALIGAILTMLANIGVSYVNGRNSLAEDKLKAASDLELERLKAKYELILQSIATNDPAVAKRNIEFFIAAGLLDDPEGAIRGALERYNPVLPAASGAAAPTHGVLPSDIAKLYGFPPNLDGAGQKVALVEFAGGFRRKDVAAYFAETSHPLPEIVEVAVAGAKHDRRDADASGQVLADIQVVGSIVPKAQLRVYFAPPSQEGWTTVLQQLVDDGVGVALINWGGPERQWDLGELRVVDAALQAATEKGVTIVTSVGDQGAALGGDDAREVAFPATSPWVLAVGGTDLDSGPDGIRAEVVWNDPHGGSSGGGVSRLIAAPPWQGAMRVEGAALTGRAIPDVSAVAWNTLSLLGVGKSLAQAGGTCIAAAVWAGLIARINQGLGRNVGHLNPRLYQAIGPARVLRPITKGDNSRPGVKGYAATDSWSPVAGWGAPDGAKLLEWLQKNG